MMVPMPVAGGSVRAHGRQWMRAPSPLEPLAGVDVDGELVGHPLVGHHHGAAVAARSDRITRLGAPTGSHMSWIVSTRRRGRARLERRVGSVALLERPRSSTPCAAAFMPPGAAAGAASRSMPVTVTFG